VNCLKESAVAFSSVYLDDLDDHGTSWPRGSCPQKTLS
jgi:hypothetical protein